MWYLKGTNLYLTFDFSPRDQKFIEFNMHKSSPVKNKGFINSNNRVTAFDARKYRPTNIQKIMSPDLLNIYKDIVEAKYDRSKLGHLFGPQIMGNLKMVIGIVVEKDPEFEHRQYRKIMKNWVHLTDPNEGMLLGIIFRQR